MKPNFPVTPGFEGLNLVPFGTQLATFPYRLV